MFGTRGLFNGLRTGCIGDTGGDRRAGGPRRRPSRVPHLETLEERRVLSGYTLINMGSLGGSPGIDPDINSRGTVVGGSEIANNAAEHAFLYTHGRMTDLGTLGGSMSRALGINDRGDVVGFSTTAPGTMPPDVFLDRHGRLADLGVLNPSGPYGDIKINNHGDIIGFSVGNGDAALDRGGKMLDLGSLAGRGSVARALNDRGLVVGSSVISGTGSSLIVHAFLYTHGRMADLGTLGGADSIANDINAHGQVVGVSALANRDEHAFLYTHGRMADLGTLGGSASNAGAINDRGQVVGASQNGVNASRGFLYKNGTMIDLNSLIPANSGFVIFNAEDINDRGQIAARAVSTNAQDHNVYDVLLTPTGHRR